MKLYLIRHAVAEERAQFALKGLSDELRPLTPKGAERMNEIVGLFKKLEPDINLILSSPLVRSLQTAEILKLNYSKAQLVTSDNLKPDHSAQKLFEEIQTYDLDSMALIGHEPDLGQFLSWLLFRQATDHFPMKKSGIAKVDIYKDGRTYLKWLIRPKLLSKNF